MLATPPEPPKCEISFCTKPAIGHYRWGDVPQQQGNLCAQCSITLWQMCSPAVKDRMVITPLTKLEVAHA